MFDFLAQIRRSLQTTRGFKRNQPRRTSRSELLETRQLLAADFRLVKDVNPLPDSNGGKVSDLVMVGTNVYFAAADANGTELWKSDGTAVGTVQVKDIFGGIFSSDPRNLTNVNGTLYFTANDGMNGDELWKSDGTAAGTVLVRNVRLGNSGSDAYNLINVNGALYFTANDGTNGQELWKSDGTAAGTVMVKDIGSASSSAPGSLTNLNGRLYFTADDGSNGKELWKSDGTAAGTVMVKDIWIGIQSSCSYSSSLTNVNGTLYFTAKDGSNGEELWKSNGTAAGTVLVKDIDIGRFSSRPFDFTNVNGALYFKADDGTKGWELWKSDGTAAGTVLVKDIQIGSESSVSFSSADNVNGTLYFTADDGLNGQELWKSDGTAAGTILVRDLSTRGDGAFPWYLTNVNGTLYFTADDGSNGRELWKSDGTAAGTILVRDLSTGSDGAFPSYLTNVNGKLYFTADDGTEALWKSNGTTSGTQRFNGVAGGYASFGGFFLFDRELSVVNNLVYFTGSNPAAGNELFVQDLTCGTEFNDSFVLNYSGTGRDQKVTVTLSINGGPVETLGIFPTTFPLPITGLGGNDSVRIEGTVESDKFIGDASSVSINGTTVLLSGIESRTLAGGAGNDVYQFDADNLLGTFTLDEAGGGVDTIDLAATTAAVTLNLSTSATQTVNVNLSLNLKSESTFDNAIGGSGNDTLTGNLLANTLTGNAGNDRLTGGAGNDSLVGGSGDDNYVFATATTVEADAVAEAPSAGTDTLSFSSLTTDVMLSLETSFVQTVHANRSLKLNASSVFEDIVGGSGNDTLTGNALANKLTSNAGNDRLNGGSGDDSLAGGSGDDSYVFRTATTAEADTVAEAPNAGTDTLSFSTLTTDVMLSLETSIVQTVHSNRSLKLNSGSVFEHIVGGSGNDMLTGNALPNTLTSNAGNDRLTGGSGDDSLVGGSGDDTYVFATALTAEADIVTEGTSAGTDTLSFGLLTTDVMLSLKTIGVQSVHSNRTLKLNTTDAFENIVGGSGNDTLTGNSLGNILVGNAGSDNLSGSGGRDILIGGLGLDTLNGGEDEDILIAGRTTSDTNLIKLIDMRTEWTSTNAYTSRITNLRSGVGASIASLKAKANVLNDAGEDDSLTAATGTDWFFRALDDVISDLVTGELVDVL